MRAIRRRDFLKAAGAGAGLAAMTLPRMLRAAEAAARKPNIIVILADDLGYADVGLQGCTDIPTPHVDSIGRGGVRLTSGYVSHPFCSPTRAGLMTGRYQQRFGHEGNPVYNPANETHGLPLDQVTLPQTLKAAGYVTGMVGKWHLGAAPHFHPMKRGFDEFFGFLGGGHDYFKAEMQDTPREYSIPIQRDGKSVPLTGYLTDVFGGEAAAFIDRHRKEPFFLYLAFNAPHTPLQAPEKYVERVKDIADATRRSYAAMVAAMDDAIGVVLEKLRSTGLERDTLLVFLSDNGGPGGVTHASNAPLRGNKGSVLEGGIRVPLLVRWPARLPAGKTCDEPVISLDIFPTAVAAASCRLPADLKLDGVNFLPHIEGQASGPPHERLFWRTGGGAAMAVREGRFKVVRTGEKPPELYDLKEDIGEAKDLASDKPDVVARLVKAYEEWNKELVPPLWGSPQPAAKKKQARAF
jgi:arylsulfatase A-like enzyme